MFKTSDNEFFRYYRPIMSFDTSGDTSHVVQYDNYGGLTFFVQRQDMEDTAPLYHVSLSVTSENDRFERAIGRSIAYSREPSLTVSMEKGGSTDLFSNVYDEIERILEDDEIDQDERNLLRLTQEEMHYVVTSQLHAAQRSVELESGYTGIKIV